MRRPIAALFAIVLLFPSIAITQTLTYHLDNPSGVTGQWLLSTASPTGTVWTVKSQSLTGASTGEYFIASFPTASGDPAKVGTIPSGATVTFAISMQESKNGGTIFPRAKLYLNSASGTLLCMGTGTTAITGTATVYTFSCSTSAAITMASTDRFFLWVGVNMTKAPTGGAAVTANVQFNGSQGGVTDSTLLAPVPPPPSITSLSVTSGNAGTPVTIVGNLFGSTTGTVTFNGTSAAISSWSNGSIGTSVPTLASTGNVVVTNANGSSNGVGFTVPPPAISSLSSSSGAAGTPVTITGSHFGGSQSPGTVTFNGTAASISNWSDGSINTSVPVHAVSGNVVVTAVNGEASSGVAFTIPAPVITNVSPDSARVNAPVTIAGNNFGTVQGSLTFNGTAAVPTSWNNNQIQTSVPTAATTGPVVVTQAGNSNSVVFTVDPPPSITGISPSSGQTNTRVTVSGAGFGLSQDTSTIQFNGTAAKPFSWSDGSIIVPVPVGASTGPVVVTAGGLTSNGVSFTVTPGPTITGLSISSGAPGAPVTISGQNFGSSSTNNVVRFNGLPAPVTSWNSNSIGVTVPTGATTGPVTATVNGLTSNGVTFTAITTGTLSGTVSNGGTGISGATVQALQNGAVRGSSTANSSGAFTIATLPSGNYDVQASAVGFGTGLISSVAVTAGQTSTSNFSLVAPGTISGKVTQPDGVTAIGGATVQYLVGAANGGSTTTDSTGNYSIGGLNAGSYTLEAGAAGYVAQSQAVRVAGGTTTTSNFLLQQVGSNPINYVYDELGRLVSVIDSSGDTATYKYDAVGNILSISRQNSNQLSIISFTPQRGTPGAPVTINGTGFSSTISQDGISFNGVSATVNSATTTQITTAVPAGASTGPITVTTPSGSVSSTANFTVLGTSGAPTVTGFTPNPVLTGTAVSITGTNFDIASNDKVTFNANYAPATSATNSQVTAIIPLATGSGRVSVTTPNGTGTSTQDLYIPFGGHAVADIGYTGRIAFGGSQTITLASNKIAMLLFDGVAGQGASVQLNGSTFATTCSLFVYLPNGNQGDNQNGSDCISTFSPTFLGPMVLPSTGTYTIGLDPGANSGSISIGLTQDLTASITPGTPVNLSISTPGQGAHYTFQGTAGQVVSAEVAGFSGIGVTLSILNPDTSTLASNSVTNGTANLVGVKLPKAGTYQLVVAPSGTGSATVSLITQTTNPFINFGTPTSSTMQVTSVTGYSFNGAAGQVVSAEVAGFAGGGFTMYLLNPDGSTLASACCSSQESIIGKKLTASGTYQIVVVPNNGVTGIAVFSVASQTTNPTINFNTPSSSPVASSLVAWSFNGTAGQVVSAEVAGFSGFEFYLLNPDGSMLASTPVACCGNNQLSILGKTLGTTGTYQIVVVPNNGVTGTAVVSLTSQTTNPTINFNAPVTSTINTSGLISLDFSGTTGQAVNVEVAGLSSFSMTLLNPDGSTLASTPVTCCGNNQTSILGKTLGTTGTYQIVVVPNNGVTGTAVVSLTSQTTNPSISFNTPVSSTINTSSLISLSFSGTAGQVVSAELTGFSSFGMTLLNPDGSTLASTSACCGNNQASIVGKTLGTTGIYQIVITPNSGVTGTAVISLTSQTTNPTISFNTPVSNTINTSSLIGLSFSGTAGQVVSVELTGFSSLGMTLLNPDGSTLASTSTCCGNNQASMIGKTLGTTGIYQIVITPNSGVTGTAVISLTSQTTNPTISFNTPVSNTINTSSLISLSFSGTAGQVVSTEVTGLSSFNVSLLNPDGSTLASVCCATNQASIVGKTLGTTGTYQIVITPNNNVVGTAEISLTSQTTNPTINFNTPVSSTINASSLISLSFSGTAGQVVSTEVTGLSSFNVSLLNPDGSTLASVCCATNQASIVGKTLGTTATYQIVITPNNGVTGTANVSITSQTTNGTITFGTPVNNTVTVSSLIGLSFSGSAGQTVSTQITPSFGGGTFGAYVLNPDGSTLAFTTSSGTVTFSGKTLGSTGTYQILIVPNNGAVGSATTSLTSP